MAKVIVFQHVPYEPLGTLDPLLRQHRHRIRYVNFSRHQHTTIHLDDYDALIVLGGPMNVDEIEKYPFLLTEIKAIQQALAKNIPILGICLGSQLLAAALGTDTGPAEHKEIGWVELDKTPDAADDPLMRHWKSRETLFQWHGFTFDLPNDASLLVSGKRCKNQAFRYGQNAYGFQFHLEITSDLVHRWLTLPTHQDELSELDLAQPAAHIRQETEQHLPNSLALSQKVFEAFLELIPSVDRNIVLKSR